MKPQNLMVLWGMQWNYKSVIEESAWLFILNFFFNIIYLFTVLGLNSGPYTC
jgi:hypothetical protein